MVFCCSDLFKWQASDAYSIDIIIQDGKLGRDSGKASVDAPLDASGIFGYVGT
jgi:hypothetical protein